MQNVFLVAPFGRVVGESHSWQKTGTAVTTLVRQGLSTRRVIVRNRHSVCAGGLRHPCILRLPRAALSTPRSHFFLLTATCWSGHTVQINVVTAA